jgi:hypothetical protein
VRALLITTLAALAACTASPSGQPAAPYALSTPTLDGGGAPVEASAPPPPNVPFEGKVVGAGASGVAGAVVIVEVGGLGRVNPLALGPDGGRLATILVDPYVRFGALTDDAGSFAFSAIPAGEAGVHTLAASFGEDTRTAHVALSPASDGGSPDASVLVTLSGFDGGGSDGGGALPTVTGLTANPAVVAPFTDIEFAMNVAGASAADPLSQDIFLVEPTTAWAGALAPASPAVAGGPYPDGVYNRIVRSPGSPGVYTYTAVVGSMHGRTSAPVTVVVTVTATGLPPIPDAGLYDGEVFPEAGGLPDGRQ